MHSTSNARFALVCLLGLLGTVVLARVGEAHFGARAVTPDPRRRRENVVLPGQALSEGNRLRDGGKIDPNLASAIELELLPGVGPQLAREIVATRARMGAFHSLEQLGKVRGIGPKTLAKLAPLLSITSPRSEGLEHATEAH